MQATGKGSDQSGRTYHIVGNLMSWLICGGHYSKLYDKVHTGKFCVKFEDFSRTYKRISYWFQGLKTYEKY